MRTAIYDALNEAGVDVLFDESMDGSAWALFDSTRTYRYVVGRDFVARPKSYFVVVLCNPSKASAFVLDNTVRKMVKLAKALGHDALVVVNIFAFMSTDPHVLPVAVKEKRDIIGRGNDAAIVAAVQHSARVVVGWGTPGALLGRGAHVLGMLRPVAVVEALHVTKDGHPGHPLYLPDSVKPVPLIGPQPVQRAANAHAEDT